MQFLGNLRSKFCFFSPESYFPRTIYGDLQYFLEKNVGHLSDKVNVGQGVKYQASSHNVGHMANVFAPKNSGGISDVGLR